MKRYSSRLPRVEVRDQTGLRQWLKANHRQSGSIWLVSYRKTVPTRYLSYSAIVDEALCFGWIDSLPRNLDSRRTMRLLSPRKPKSAWSRRNKERVTLLRSEGRMQPADEDAIERAKQDGSWSKLDTVEKLGIPPDLRSALNARPAARAHFNAFPPSSRRLILEWISQARRAETRSKRIEDAVKKAAIGVRAHHYRQLKNLGKKGLHSKSNV